MQQARVCLAPLRFGAGLKGKLIDAMQCGTPSVTTSIGAEGLHGQDLWPGAIADNLDPFVEAAVELYESPEHWQRAHQQCAAQLQPFAADQLIPLLSKKLEETKAGLETHRRRNRSEERRVGKACCWRWSPKR